MMLVLVHRLFDIDKMIFFVVGLLFLGDTLPRTIAQSLRTANATSSCFYAKKIILDVNKCGSDEETTCIGLGNRILALTSAAMMAAGMNRVLQLQWAQNAGCGATYEELFT